MTTFSVTRSKDARERMNLRRASRSALAWLGAIGVAAIAVAGCSSANVGGAGEETTGAQSQAVSPSESVVVSLVAKNDFEVDLRYSHSCDEACAIYREQTPITSVTLTRTGATSVSWGLPNVDGGPIQDTNVSTGSLYTYSVCYLSKGPSVCGNVQLRTDGPGQSTSTFGSVPGVSASPNDGTDRIAVHIGSDHPYDHYNVQWGVACAGTGNPCGAITQWDTQWGRNGGGSSVDLTVGPASASTSTYFVNAQGCDFTFWGNSVCGGWSKPVTVRAPRPSSSALTAAPSVSAIVPSSGIPEGGTSVRIDGAGFDVNGGTLVYFGRHPASSVTCPSTTQCFATSPAGGGVTDVMVMVNDVVSALGATAKYSYVPSVLSVTPSHGAAGDKVTITGLGFSSAPGAVSFSFGGTPATSFSCYPGPDCWAVVPPGAGLVDVRATVSGHTTGIAAGDLFSYDAPTITSISASSGSIAGGTMVDIVGTGFDPNASTDKKMRVLFGTTPTDYIICANSQLCTVRSPAVTSPGPVHIAVESLGVLGATSAQDVFTYRAQGALAQFTWDPTSTSAHVQIDGSAPSGGAIVSLSSNSSAISVPATVTIPAGMVGAFFPVTIVPSPAAGTATLAASFAGTSMTTQVSYVAWPVVALTIGPMSLAVNESTPMTVYLDTPAPAGGAVVSLSSSMPTAIAVPASIVVPAGSQSATITIENVYAGATKDVSITASYKGFNAAQSVAVPTAACKPRKCPKGTMFNPQDCACEDG